MKVMTAMYTLRKGGSYDRFKMMIEAFLERNCEIHCLSLTPIQIKHPFFHNYVMYFPFGRTDGLLARFLVLTVFPLWSVWIAWKKRIDLLIAFGSLYAFIQGFSKWFLRRPMVTFIRGNSSFGLQARKSFRYAVCLNKGIENIGLSFSDRIITNNTGLRREILQTLGRRNIEVEVLFNNIPSMNIDGPEDAFKTKHRYGIPSDAKVLVSAGVLNRGKNIEMLMTCLKKSEVENLYMLIAGDGSTGPDFHYKDFLKRLAKELGVEKKVVFAGWLKKEDLWKVYLASDLFVLPSINEGMPNAMLEALGAGLPCVGTDIAGIKDILLHQDLLFDPSDEKALTLIIQRVFAEDGQFLDRIKGLCQERKKVFEFDWGEKVFQIATLGVERACHRI